MASLNSDPTDVFNDIETAAITTIEADSFLGNGTTTLSSGINAAVTTIPMTSLTNFSGKGQIKIDSEIIRYTGTSDSTLTGATRGHRGTTAATHDSGATVTNYNVVTRHQKLREIGGDGRFYFDPELPALAVYAWNLSTDEGDTFGQWDQSITLMTEVVDVSGDLDTAVENVQMILSEVLRLMRYQLDAASGNLDGIADAVHNLSGLIVVIRDDRGRFVVRGEGQHLITLITTE